MQGRQRWFIFGAVEQPDTASQANSAASHRLKLRASLRQRRKTFLRVYLLLIMPVVFEVHLSSASEASREQFGKHARQCCCGQIHPADLEELGQLLRFRPQAQAHQNNALASQSRDLGADG